VSADGFTKMSIYGMNMDLFSSSPIVILKVEDENRYLPIWIGQPEARSILMKLQNQEFVRPLTHDLALNLVNELGASMERITVTALKDQTFFATISLDIDGKTVEVDSRPSDAIALAIRSGPRSSPRTRSFRRPASSSRRPWRRPPRTRWWTSSRTG